MATLPRNAALSDDFDDNFGPDIAECTRCNGTGNITCRAHGSMSFVCAGWPPDDARGVIGMTCDRCGGVGYVEIS